MATESFSVRDALSIFIIDFVSSGDGAPVIFTWKETVAGIGLYGGVVGALGMMILSLFFESETAFFAWIATFTMDIFFNILVAGITGALSLGFVITVFNIGANRMKAWTKRLAIKDEFSERRLRYAMHMKYEEFLDANPTNRRALVGVVDGEELEKWKSDAN